MVKSTIPKPTLYLGKLKPALFFSYGSILKKIAVPGQTPNARLKTGFSEQRMTTTVYSVIFIGTIFNNIRKPWTKNINNRGLP